MWGKRVTAPLVFGFTVSKITVLELNLYNMYCCVIIGKIGRDSAVKMLQSAPFGSYLVRLSAKLWGYTISVRSELFKSMAVSYILVFNNDCTFCSI